MPGAALRPAAEDDVTEPYDILIEGGTIVDGTGRPGLRRDGRGHRRPRFACSVAPRPARRPSLRSPLGAGSMRAAMSSRPGFIDLHSHGGLAILAEPRHEPKVRQGVTTEVIGVDGNAYAPFRTQPDLDDFLTLNAGLDGRPEGLAYDWRTVADYLARFDRRVAVNIAYLVGNSALRIAAIGWDEVEADAAPRWPTSGRSSGRASRTGAFGLSSGLDYPPGAYASTDELAELLAEASRLGGFYHTHVRYPLGDALPRPVPRGDRDRPTVRRRARPHHPLLPSARRSRGRRGDMLGLVDDARAEGLDVSFDLYPYEWASTRLLIMLPTWIQAGGVAALKERLADRAVRARIRDELAGARSVVRRRRRLGRPAAAATSPDPSTQRWEGRTLGGRTWPRPGSTRSTASASCSLSEDLRVNEVAPGPHRPAGSPFLVARPVDDRHRQRADRRQAIATDVRVASRASSASSSASSGCSASRRPSGR